MKKIFVATLMTAVALSLCACSGTSSNTAGSSSSNDRETGNEKQNQDVDSVEKEEKDHNVDSIDFTLKGGNLKFVGIEKANSELISNNADVDIDKVVILKFDFTNTQDQPAQCLSTFRTEIYQNGTQLSENLSYSSKNEEQYELCGNYLDNVMKGGTVTFGRLVQLEDDSPITIYAKPNGVISDDYQVMELAVSEVLAASHEAEASEEAQTLKVGDTVTSEDWEITLSKAYTSDVLQSDESSTYWEADDGYAFLVLEFDVECLNSSQKAVDGDAITDLVATTSTGNTYNDWTYQYISSQIWLFQKYIS